MKSVVLKGKHYMVQPVDFTKPIYNAVNINIKKPEVNAGQESNPLEINSDNGIYNAVKIDIDNPKINTQPKAVYDYPESNEIVTYGMLDINPIMLPSQVNAYKPEESDFDAAEDNTDTDADAKNDNIDIPAPNYTTLAAEKENIIKNNDDKSFVDGIKEEVSSIAFRANDNTVKRPEIIPSEDILPNVDIALVASNLSSNDRDVQALQMEEIVRLALTDKDLAKDFLVSDVFTNLINITKEDATKLAPPSKQQEEIRLKFLANWLAAEQDPKAKQNPPYKLTKEEEAIAMELSPMELAERNKEYALTTLGVLSEMFIEDYEDKEGRVIPITDAPGVAAIVDALRKDPDSGVKLAAIDALRQISRPEYKNELSAVLTIVQTDPNPNVSAAAKRTLDSLG